MSSPPTVEFSFPPRPDFDPQDDSQTLSDELVDGEWTKLNHHNHHQATSDPHHSHTNLSSPQRSQMPAPLRFSQQSLTHLQRDSSHKSILDSWLARRPSVPSATVASHATTSKNATLSYGHSLGSKSKNKDRSLDSSEHSAFGFGYGYVYDADNVVSTFSNPSASITSTDSSPHSPAQSQSHNNHVSPSQPRRPRTSLLSAASDALGLRRKIGSVSRKKTAPPSSSHAASIMPGVIEINAHNDTTVTSTVGGTTAHRDYEYEERERLRDAAAQSIGLDPELLHESRRSESIASLDSPQGPAEPTRIPPFPAPPFPATLAALRPLTLMSATLPKFSPPSSLLVYALSKQWKPRTIVLTSHVTSHKTHVHLFKGASPDEKELERLEVTEDSVIFVAEEEVGGRGNVVKFAGKDVGVKRTGAPGEESARTMWFLQFTDPAESQRWIAAIKNAVLTQRSLRVGLGIAAHTDGGHEPKGDMDVMLSMRLQGIISTQPTTLPAVISPAVSLQPSSPSPPPSLRSLRMNMPSPSPNTAVKGIFTGTRSRSPSLEGSHSLAVPPTHPEDSFGAAGASLLTMLRTNVSTDPISSPSDSLPLPLPHAPPQGSPAPSIRSTSAPIVITASDLKISKERDVPGLESSPPETSSTATPTGSNTPPTPSFSHAGVLTLSLQPPPRKSKHGSLCPVAASPEPQGLYRQPGGNRSVAGNFGVRSISGVDDTARMETNTSESGLSLSLSAGSDVGALSPGGETWMDLTDEPTPTASCSAAGSSPPSGDGFIPAEKLTNSIPITKRWSRQGNPLPKRLTPPSGPPPSIPHSPESHRSSSTSSTSTPLRPPSSASSSSPSQRGMSPQSGSSLSPTFWKRASGSSVYTASSSSTSDSRTPAQFAMPIVESFPSSVGSDGAPSRPMSLLVPGPSSAMPHIGSTKRRSMPPPRPAPNFAPPPAPTDQGPTPGPPSTTPVFPPSKSFRDSVAKRAMRLSLTAPKPPPSSVLPPRPDEAAYVQGHRRSSSSGNTASSSISGVHHNTSSSRPSSLLSGSPNPNPNLNPSTYTSPSRGFSIRQRLRILSTPPTTPAPAISPSSLPALQVSTLDLGDDNDNEPSPSHPYTQSHQNFGLGEHITTMQNDPSFLQLSTPVTPTIPKPPPRSPFRPMPQPSSPMSGMSTLPLESNHDFVSLSPPPPRRGSKQLVVAIAQPDKPEVEVPVSIPEESKLAALSQRGSVVSLGFVTTS